MKHNIIQTIKTIVLALILVAGLQFALADWTTAPPNPPQNNVSAPINVGAGQQTKGGSLWLNTNTTTGGNQLAIGLRVWGLAAFENGAKIVGGLQIPTGAGLNKVLTSDADGDATWQELPAAQTNGSSPNFEYQCISPASGNQHIACFQLNKLDGVVIVKTADQNANATGGAIYNTGMTWTPRAVVQLNPLSFNWTGQAPYGNFIVTDAAAGSSFPTMCVTDKTGVLGCAVAGNWQYGNDSTWAKLAAPF